MGTLTVEKRLDFVEVVLYCA